MDATPNQINTAIDVLKQMAADNDRTPNVQTACAGIAAMLSEKRQDAVGRAAATTGAYLEPLLEQAMLRVAKMRGEFEAAETIMKIARRRFDMFLSYGDALVLLMLYKTERGDVPVIDSDAAFDLLFWFFQTYAAHTIDTDRVMAVKDAQ